MRKYINPFIRLSENFHVSINPHIESLLKIAEENGSASYNKDHFQNPRIKGKIYLLKKILDDVKHLSISLALLDQIESLLVEVQKELEYHFREYKLAICFAFSQPENKMKLEEAIGFLTQYTLEEGYRDPANFHISYVGYHINGFPPDCDFKFYGVLKDNKVKVIGPLCYPEDKLDEKLGEQIYSCRTRDEHNNIVEKFKDSDPLYYQKVLNETRTDFTLFCKKVHESNKKLLGDIERLLESINSIIKVHTNKSLILNIEDIKTIYNLLVTNNYIKEKIERFMYIFSIDYVSNAKNKLTWLRSGPRLKYFIDQLIIKYQFCSNHNLWIADRFLMEDVKDLRKYLGKQTHSKEYQDLINRILKNDPIFKFFLKNNPNLAIPEAI